VVTVVTQPDRRRGRGGAASPSPVARLAERHGITLLRPERVGEPQVVEALASERPDLGVVVAFGQFLPRRIREAPTRGYLINGHASLLPRFRGAAPIAHAILAGETITGVSVMRVEREMDAGPVALTREIPIGPEETAGELSARVSQLTADAIAEVVERIAGPGIEWVEQDSAHASFAPKIERADARLNWSEPAEALVRRVRAMAPSPGAFTEWDDQMLRILAARAEPGRVDRPPGTVRRGDDVPLRIATSDGWLLPQRVQRPGGRSLDVESYLRGRPLADGARFT
jgi:methionyl-tRNA formyltransferase